MRWISNSAARLAAWTLMGLAAGAACVVGPGEPAYGPTKPAGCATETEPGCTATPGTGSTGTQTTTAGTTGDVATDSGTDTGPQTQPPACRGTPASCIGRGNLQTCESVEGCGWGGVCKGTPTPCDEHQAEAPCAAQLGCWWSFTQTACMGSARACSLLQQRTDCLDAGGCRWGEACTGTPTPCEQATDDILCELQPGCHWQ